jgi:hypothetical protein
MNFSDEIEGKGEHIDVYSTTKNSITINEYPYFKLDDEQNIQLDIINPINEYSYSSLFNIESCKQSTCFVLPQSIENNIKSSNSFQQLWSLRVYSPKLIDSENPSWSLINLLSKILQYEPIFFVFCYLFGALIGTHIDFLLIFTCIISILVVTYEKWLFHFNKHDHSENNIDNKNRYSKQIKLATLGFAIGTISTLIVK